MRERALAPAVKVALDHYSRALRDRFGARVAELVLFGSHARGTAHEDSDVDLLVAIDGLTEEERTEAMDMAYLIDFRAEDWAGLSPLVYSAEQVASLRRGGRRLLRDIDREGVHL
jgi:predicted nucleotidyltransferase